MFSIERGGHIDQPLPRGLPAWVIRGHIEIADKVTITAMSRVTHSIREPGEYSSGTPIEDNRSWRRNAARFKQLDALFRRLKPGKE